MVFVNDGRRESRVEWVGGVREEEKGVNYVKVWGKFGKEVGMVGGFD